MPVRRLDVEPIFKNQWVSKNSLPKEVTGVQHLRLEEYEVRRLEDRTSFLVLVRTEILEHNGHKTLRHQTLSLRGTVVNKSVEVQSQMTRRLNNSHRMQLRSRKQTGKVFPKQRILHHSQLNQAGANVRRIQSIPSQKRFDRK